MTIIRHSFYHPPDNLKMKIRFWISLWMVAHAIALEGQTEFIRVYTYQDAPYLNFCNMLFVSPDTLIISGNTQQVSGNHHQGIYLAKADTLGNILFDTVLAPDDDLYIYEEQYGIIHSSRGGYVIVGQYWNKNNGVMIKTDDHFKIEFVKEFTEDPEVILNIRNEEIIELGDYYYIMSKKQHAGDGLDHSHLMKVSHTGELIWDRTWANEGWWTLFHLEKHKDQEVIMLYGLKSKAHLKNPPPDSSYKWIALIDTSGTIFYEHVVPLLPDERIDRYTSYIDDDQIYITGGYTNFIPVPFTIFSEPYIQSINQAMGIHWEYVHSPKTEGWDYVGFRSINQCIDGNFISPLIYITPYGDGGISPNRLVKFSTEGQKIWERQDSILWNPVQGVFNISNKTIVLPSGSILTCGSTYQFDSTGTTYHFVGYLMKVTNNGCLNGDCPEIISSSKDPGSNPLVDLVIYPNPSRNTFQIHSNRIMNRITILSLDGIISDEYDIHDDEATIDLSSQPAGIFIIRIFGDGYATSRTVFKN